MNKRLNRIINRFSSHYGRMNGPVFGPQDFKQEIILSILESNIYDIDNLYTKNLYRLVYWKSVDCIRKAEFRSRKDIKDGMPKSEYFDIKIACQPSKSIDFIDLYKSINRLEIRLRSIVIQIYFFDLSMKIIAKKMGVSLGRISQLHSIAITELRKILTTNDQINIDNLQNRRTDRDSQARAVPRRSKRDHSGSDG